jgi:hypothetical protein
MMGLFTDLFSTKPAEEAAKAKAAGYTAGNTSAQDALTQGQTGADALYGQAYAPYTSLIDSTGRGATAYGDATGANGATGLATAKDLFTATPGYQSGFDLLTDANDRRAASRGILASGNTIADTAKLATTYADQNYGNYVSRLAPYLSANNSAISGGAAVKGAQAGADLGVAGQKAQYGYNSATGVGNANADAALAPYSASSNFWGALTGLGGLALKASGIGGFAPTPAKA